MTSATSLPDELERSTMRRIAWRLLPFLIVCYLIAIIDRGNIGMASLQMNEDLQLTAKVFGFASSLFFLPTSWSKCPATWPCNATGHASG